jgi:hypothetical protein
VSSFEGVRVRYEVRVLDFRVLVSLGERSTCVECLLRFSRLDLGGLVSYGSYFPLGQEKKKVKK